MRIETERLVLREMTEEDFDALCRILRDEETMYAYEGAFTDTEARQWLEKQFARYREYGFGLLAVVLKQSGEMIGQCGLTPQPVEGVTVLEVGYLLQRAFWHKGYASEAALACKQYAFETLGAEAVFSIIRDTNLASQGVARRGGMGVVHCFVKHYRGVDMPHLLFGVTRGGGTPAWPLNDAETWRL